ncbi:ELP3 component of the RNA polymerase II complex, consists of [Candidatus Vecturithrix granuli]|uniref:ELP3 component of the RNA polymerase II complex, consists of n=1 Tax=Vecturithrix granuli TaxID=1499967 RepID=A0A081BXB8_VECG1|nr:ELP3 component of the RNA polymerase II complex, consists of [Candidatus Vecturithrix granuli]
MRDVTINKIIAIFLSHQGCPQRCIFCHQPHITGVALRTEVTPEDVRHTIECALAEPRSQQKGVRFEVAFYGGTFTGLALDVQEQFLHTVQAYIQRGDITGIRVSTHPRMFDDQIFALLNAYSVHLVELGVQSFDDEVLRLAQRGHTAEEAEQIIQRLHAAGIEVGIHLMVGLPGDSCVKSLFSTHKAIELQPACVRIHPTLVMQGTQLEQLSRAGQYQSLSLETAIILCKEMLRLFQTAGIPVIRIGLQPTTSLERHLIAGPYHPAMRQLVESAMFYDMMETACIAHPFADQRVVFYVSPKDLSTARGQKNANVIKLQERFHLQEVRILADDTLPRGQVRRE